MPPFDRRERLQGRPRRNPDRHVGRSLQRPGPFFLQHHARFDRVLLPRGFSLAGVRIARGAPFVFEGRGGFQPGAA